jgi:hypothetical protein
MQPVYTGRAIVGRHDTDNELLAVGDPPRRRIGYEDILLPPDDARALLVIGVDVGVEAGPLLTSSLVLTRPTGEELRVQCLL